MKNKISAGFMGLLLGGLLLAGCTAQNNGSVKIVSISPEPYAVMRAGDKVDLKVEVEYTLKKGPGNISLVAQKDGTSSIGSVREVIKEGSGRITLALSFVVPETKVVNVFVPLTPGGYTKTVIVDSRVYNVAPKK